MNFAFGRTIGANYSSLIQITKQKSVHDIIVRCHSTKSYEFMKPSVGPRITMKTKDKHIVKQELSVEKRTKNFYKIK